MRQEADEWKHDQPRPQCEQAALERQSASGSRASGEDDQAYARMHILPAQRQSRKGLVRNHSSGLKVTKGTQKKLAGALRCRVNPPASLVKDLLHADQLNIKDES